MIHIAYKPLYVYPLPEDHKFPMEKYELVPRQLLHEGTFSTENFFSPEPMNPQWIERVHDSNYVRKLKTGKISRKEERRIGFPLSDGLLEREYTITFGSMQAARFALRHAIAFNIAGGTHHAFANRGEGFCIFNDIAVSARYLLDQGWVSKILVVDLDVHQGNGTAHIFRNDPRVFTFSMHGAGNYPLQKTQSDLDVPLPQGTTDADYLSALDKHWPALLHALRPDVVFYQAGVDILESDKFGKMAVSIRGSQERDKRIFSHVRSAGIPVMVSMGGGYSPEIRHIVEAHANTYRVARQIFD